jgi:LuxR family maltose regulon positive regulatory protein
MRQIASDMYVSANTVKTHVKAIYRKFGVMSRSEAVAIARTHGLL